MTNTEREQAIRDIFESELMPLLQAKGHDYAGNEDSSSATSRTSAGRAS